MCVMKRFHFFHGLFFSTDGVALFNVNSAGHLNSRTLILICLCNRNHMFSSIFCLAPTISYRCFCYIFSAFFLFFLSIFSICFRRLFHSVFEVENVMQSAFDSQMAYLLLVNKLLFFVYVAKKEPELRLCCDSTVYFFKLSSPFPTFYVFHLFCYCSLLISFVLNAL